MTSWYIGQKVNTYCMYCNERLTTFVVNANGEHSRRTHVKCQKVIKEAENQ